MLNYAFQFEDFCSNKLSFQCCAKKTSKHKLLSNVLVLSQSELVCYVFTVARRYVYVCMMYDLIKWHHQMEIYLEGSNLVTFKSYQDSQGSSVYSSTLLPNYRSNCIDSEEKAIPLSSCRMNPLEERKNKLFAKFRYFFWEN